MDFEEYFIFTYLKNENEEDENYDNTSFKILSNSVDLKSAKRQYPEAPIVFEIANYDEDEATGRSVFMEFSVDQAEQIVSSLQDMINYLKRND